jgi:hypothetical protein
VRFHEVCLFKSVGCVKNTSNVFIGFHVFIFARLFEAFCLCFQMSISIMRRDLQGVFHFGSCLSDKK